ncbi:SLATT domain-containing protein [bacterium]|nr:SLATT domain-containing protein [bacterium]NDC94162.1 SLATT domain-containing protein [bacterium]NDD82760.1 SLATT domain-containing protein [bacterium]NDG29411.1 SLATT domain-containing protein [bacterium]
MPLGTFDTLIKDIDEKIEDLQSPNEEINLEEKSELLSINNGWNDKNEHIIISVGENAASYKWMHERSANIQKNIHIALSLLSIVISTGLSAETILATSTSDVITELRRVCIYIVTLLSVLQSFLNAQKMSEQHIVYAGEFSKLYHDIQQQMCTYRRHRIPATEYLRVCLKQYDSLVVKGPDISQLVLGQFKRKFSNSDISLPAIADRIQKIEIVSENKNTGTKAINTNNMCNNLSEIHNAFHISGDISDNDIQTADQNQLRLLRQKLRNERANFENMRFQLNETG